MIAQISTLSLGLWYKHTSKPSFEIECELEGLCQNYRGLLLLAHKIVTILVLHIKYSFGTINVHDSRAKALCLHRTLVI